MTRTTALLAPYRCHHQHDEPEYGELYWQQDELVEQVAHCYDLGIGAKFHATGDASVRAVLDAVETVQAERGPGPRFQIAHTEYVDPADLPRFAALGVVADASPYIWYPGVVQDAVAGEISEELLAASWPVRDLVESGAVVAAGSDWPCVLPTPDPWTGLQTLVTRRNVDPAVRERSTPGRPSTWPPPSRRSPPPPPRPPGSARRWAGCGRDSPPTSPCSTATCSRSRSRRSTGPWCCRRGSAGNWPTRW